MTSKIAFYTFGVMKSPIGHPEVQGFLDRAGAVYAAADGSAGFFERSIRDLNSWEHSWGPIVTPKCAPEGTDPNQLAMTLSLWRDLESVRAIGRASLGDPTGLALVGRADLPRPMADFLRLPSSGSALDDYRTWSEVLDDSFGPRRFVELPISFSDVYP